jgi:catechol 2,3-dioxygenase-like lactoylglutathione lyase family enzyme
MEELEMRIGVTEVFDDDQEKARTFYTGLLGFQVKVDASYSDTARWLTVVSPEDPNGTQLLLTPINDAAAVLQRFPRDTGAPAVSLTTEGCRLTYRELSDRGTVFVSEPTQMGYGGTDAVLEDGCGNLLNLHQD